MKKRNYNERLYLLLDVFFRLCKIIITILICVIVWIFLCSSLGIELNFFMTNPNRNQDLRQRWYVFISQWFSSIIFFVFVLSLVLTMFSLWKKRREHDWYRKEIIMFLLLWPFLISLWSFCKISFTDNKFLTLSAKYYLLLIVVQVSFFLSTLISDLLLIIITALIA